MRPAAAFAIAATAGMLFLSGVQGVHAAPAAIQMLRAQLKEPPLGIPGAGSATDRAHAEVSFLDPQQTSVVAGKSTTVDLHFHIADGLHINSHAPREKTLIPTRLAVVEKPGVNVTAVDFPPGVIYAPAFAPQEKLDVYTGDFTLRAHLTAQPGEHLLQAALRYQACDVNSCMPPRTLPVEIGISAK